LQALCIRKEGVNAKLPHKQAELWRQFGRRARTSRKITEKT